MAETTEIVTVVKMMERLPEATQKRVVEHLRDYLAEIDEDAEWDALFASTEPALVAEAQRVRAQIEQGQDEPMDYDRL
mgnify:CR=1 FL=1|jgi:uncharacterized protein YdbL (DUF1318 family)